MRKRATFATLAAIVFSAYPVIASAANYNLTATGAHQATSPAANCGTALGDAYDAFCPSDPINSTSCECDSFNANISGNQTGAVTDLSGTLHLTVDLGPAVDTPDCQPIFGELSFAGTKDTETIYLNGSHCLAKSNGNEALTGGWGTFSSANNLKALGTFVMTRKPDGSYSAKFLGKTQ